MSFRLGRQYEKQSELNFFFEKINKIANLYLDLPVKKEKIQITKIRDERGVITTDITEIKWIIWK